MHPYEEIFIPIIPLEDDPLHTSAYPFCFDETCPCHEDIVLIAEVAQQVETGLLTLEEATALVAGRTF